MHGEFDFAPRLVAIPDPTDNAEDGADDECWERHGAANRPYALARCLNKSASSDFAAVAEVDAGGARLACDDPTRFSDLRHTGGDHIGTLVNARADRGVHCRRSEDRRQRPSGYPLS